MKVLLVEDDEGVREGMAELISERAPVVSVRTVGEALAALAKEDFSVVIADMRLAGVKDGGKQVAERARERGAKVVVMTGLTQREIDRALGGVVPDAVLNKPFAIDDAVELLKKLLGG